MSPQGLLHFSMAAWSQANRGFRVDKEFPKPELFLLKGNAADGEGTNEAAREPHTKEQHRLPLVV